MDKLPEPVSRRDRPAKQPLSRAWIVDASLEILRTEGMRALTMRRIAAELDTAGASLYVYVKNREELIAMVLDGAIGTVQFPQDKSPIRWREFVMDTLAATVQVLGGYDGLASAGLGTIPTRPNTLRLVEALLSRLRAGGIDDETAAWAVDLLLMYVYSQAIEAATVSRLASQGRTAAEHFKAVEATFDALPEDEFPNLLAVRAPLMSGDNSRRVRWALEVMLDGIVARAHSR